jgi:MHS family proline/betaine transporter-like MFS transporter
VMCVMSPIGGSWSDRFGRKRITLISRILLTLLILPAFLAIVDLPSVGTLYLVVCGLAALHSINAGATGAMLPEMFPRSTRATGLSIAYAAGVSIFGGFAQFFVTWLIGFTHNPSAPAWYVIVCGVLSLVPLAFITDRSHEEI